MGRAIAGVIVGYLVMGLLVFGLLTLAWMILGVQGSFQPNSWDVSPTWAIMSVVVGLVAAYLGGLTCVKIAQDRAAALWLAGLVVVLGLAMAIPAMGAPAPTGPRPETISMTDAMTKARTPSWLLLLNPVIGAVGVLLAAGGKKS